MKTKYKFQETEGCTAFGFYVNGESLVDLPEQDQEEILNYVLNELKEQVKENHIQFSEVIKLFQYDFYECDPDPCDQCGDTVSTMVWNI